MLYNLDSPFDKSRFLAKAAAMAEKGGWAELLSKRMRTLSQNSYLHTIIAYFALQYGECAESAKHEFFKLAANHDLFVVEKVSPIRGRYKAVRSTADLTTEEMTLAIDRFRDYAAKNAGIYIPTPEDHAAMMQIEAEIERSKEYL